MELVEAITYSMISNNFVIHVPKEYDYNIGTSDKNELIAKILEIKKVLSHKMLSFYLVEDIDLAKYSKNDNETQMKYPKTKKMSFDLNGF